MDNLLSVCKFHKYWIIFLLHLIFFANRILLRDSYQPFIFLDKLNEKIYNPTSCICLIFLRCVFSNVSSKCLNRKIYSHADCICMTFLRCISAVSSNQSHWVDICVFFQCVFLGPQGPFGKPPFVCPWARPPALKIWITCTVLYMFHRSIEPYIFQKLMPCWWCPDAADALVSLCFVCFFLFFSAVCLPQNVCIWRFIVTLIAFV